MACGVVMRFLSFLKGEAGKMSLLPVDGGGLFAGCFYSSISILPSKAIPLLLLLVCLISKMLMLLSYAGW